MFNTPHTHTYCSRLHKLIREKQMNFQRAIWYTNTFYILDVVAVTTHYCYDLMRALQKYSECRRKNCVRNLLTMYVHVQCDKTFLRSSWKIFKNFPCNCTRCLTPPHFISFIIIIIITKAYIYKKRRVIIAHVCVYTHVEFLNSLLMMMLGDGGRGGGSCAERNYVKD